MKDLPQFKAHNREDVISFLTQVLAHPNKSDSTYFRHLLVFEDGHYGAEFRLDYFGSDEIPTKSQWNSLKKKLKRHDKRLFVFKKHSIKACDEPIECGFFEFGFFAN